jgi:hypothetical protein
MKAVFLTLLALSACAAEIPDEAVAVEADNQALSAAMTWPSLKTRGYDTLNSLKCYVDAYGGNSSCRYGVDYYGRQCTGGWACAVCQQPGSWGFKYSTRVDPYTGRGSIWVSNTRIVSNVALGPLLAGDLRTFSYDNGQYCRLFKSWGGTYAEFGP